MINAAAVCINIVITGKKEDFPFDALAFISIEAESRFIQIRIHSPFIGGFAFEMSVGIASEASRRYATDD